MERSGWSHHVTVHIAKLAAQQTGVNCERCSTWDVVWWKVLRTLLHKIRASFFFTIRRLKTTGAAALPSQMRQICEKPHFFFLFLECPPFVIPASFPQTLCFLGSATSFSLSLGCSSVVAYTRFPVMFSLLSSALLVYHKPIQSNVMRPVWGWTLALIAKKKKIKYFCCGFKEQLINVDMLV